MQEYFERIIKSDARIQELYDDVNSKLEAIDKKLKVITGGVPSAGVTWREKDEVIIEMDEKKAAGKEVAVFIHELGEVDYIGSGLPYIKTVDEDYKGSLKVLNECFSHWHIHKVMGRYAMRDLMEDSSSANFNQELKDNQSDNLIYLLYKICTWPDRENEILDNDKYSSYKNDLEKILGFLKSIDTLDVNADNRDSYVKIYGEIIQIINNKESRKEITLLDGKNDEIINIYK